MYDDTDGTNDDGNINNNNNDKDFEMDGQCQEIDIEQLVGLKMIVDKNETHRVKIEPATAHHMVGVSLSAFHKPEIYLLLGIFIQRSIEVII